MRHELVNFRSDALRCESALRAIDAATRAGLETSERLRATVDVIRREGQHLDHYPKMVLLRVLNDPFWAVALKQAAPKEEAVRALFTEVKARPSRLNRYPTLLAALGNLPRNVATDIATLRGAARRLRSAAANNKTSSYRSDSDTVTFLHKGVSTANNEDIGPSPHKGESIYGRGNGGSNAYWGDILGDNPLAWCPIFIAYSMEAWAEALNNEIPPAMVGFCARYLACQRHADAKRAACVQSTQTPSNPLTGAIGANVGAEALCAAQWLVDKSVCVMQAYTAGVRFPKS